MDGMGSTGIVILAAGESRRLGQPKQLLPYQGSSLIRRITGIAVQVVHKSVVVVLGAHASNIRQQLDDIPVHIRYNPDWANGIASSIREGLMSLVEISPATEAAIFCVCDQPHISRGLFSSMISVREKTHKSIVACAYNNALGTPVLFSQEHFSEILKLKNNEGARIIIQNHPRAVESVSFPLGSIDIDTLWDYATLQL